MKEQPQDRGVERDPRGTEKDCLAQDHEQDADVHGIAHVTVKALDYEAVRGSDGCGRAVAAEGESPEGGVEVDGESEGDGEGADGEVWCRNAGRLMAAQEPGNDSGDGAGGEDGEQQRIEQGSQASRF